MSTTLSPEDLISSTERGLSITGTRITVYDVLGYLKAGWPLHLVQNWLNLDDRQLDAAIAYIENHRNGIETEYQQVLQDAQESREYWQTRNRDRLAHIETLPPKPDSESLREKIQTRKAALASN